MQSCQTTDCRSDKTIVAPIPVNLTIENLDEKLYNAGSVDDVLAFLEANPATARYLFHADEYPEWRILANRMFKLINDPHIDTLRREAFALFEQNRTQFLATLAEGLGRMKVYYPDFTLPKIQIITSGLYQDMYISDSLIVISIDYFIGPQATYKPNDIPNYILRRYQYAYLPATILSYLIEPFLAPGSENSLLSEMIDYGKTYYFVSQLLPCTPDHHIIGFTETEIKESITFQEVIWATIIENEVLFETSEFTKRKFLGERPNVYEIGENCPGRIGAWVGWQIVKTYQEKTEQPIQQMLQMKDHHRLFEISRYKPKKGKN